jgi:prolyl-tRNA editing enzyme YbaK/EbsC (Cys-tRNA(Pro) deacylase)
MPQQSLRHRPRVGDVVEVAGHRVGDARRTGEVLAVLGEPGAEHLRVRWDDGHESLFYPSTDAIVRSPQLESRGSAIALDMMEELARRALGYELIRHERTQRAVDEAAAVGVAPAEVAKTVVLATGGGYVRAVVSASDRLDLHKTRALIEGAKKTCRLATEAELAGAYPTFELGAVPPFGGPAGDRVIVDTRVAKSESVVLEAGSHDQSVKMKTQDLLNLTKAEIADIHAD